MDLKWKYQKQSPESLSTKRCSENFAKIMEKHEVSFNKVSDLQIATLWRRDSDTGVVLWILQI